MVPVGFCVASITQPLTEANCISMTHSLIDFQGEWPELLKTELEDLILEHDPPQPNGAPPRNGSSADRPPRRHVHSPPRWIAQYNSAPTGPLYAVGRPGRNGQRGLGPVLSTSRIDLLDKLRALLRAEEGPASSKQM